jgi:hypothetical protein
VTMGQRGRSGAREVVVIARREREEVVGVLTNDAKWRRSCGDGHTTAEIGGRVGVVDNVGALVALFMGP